MKSRSRARTSKVSLFNNSRVSVNETDFNNSCMLIDVDTTKARRHRNKSELFGSNDKTNYTKHMNKSGKKAGEIFKNSRLASANIRSVSHFAI